MGPWLKNSFFKPVPPPRWKDGTPFDFTKMYSGGECPGVRREPWREGAAFGTGFFWYIVVMTNIAMV